MRYSFYFAGLLALSAGAYAQDAEQSRTIEVANGGFELADVDGMPDGWSGNTLASRNGGEGFVSAIDRENPATGSSSVRIESVGEVGAKQFGTLMQDLAAKPLRGRKIRLSARSRVGSTVPNHAGLWLRVDRQIGGPFFYDYMIDRPITSSDWATYVIETDVAPDATAVYFGFSISGEGGAWVDDLKIEDIGPATVATIENPTARPGPSRDGPVEGDVDPSVVSDLGAANLQAFARLYGLVRWFHPTHETMSVDWDRFVIAHVPTVEAAKTPDELAEVLRAAFGPLTSSLQINVGRVAAKSEVPSSEQHIRWRHSGYAQTPIPPYSSETELIPAAEAPEHWSEALPGGVAIDLPLSTPVNSYRQTLPIRGADVVPDMGKPEGWVPAGFDRTTRLAGIVSFWALQDHFYPYWEVVDADWDAAFATALHQAAIAPDDIAYSDVLRRLVAKLQDGHGHVDYRNDAAFLLPLDWAWIEEQLVITATSPEAIGIELGMVVKAIDGVPAEAMVADAIGLGSGSGHVKRYKAESKLRTSHESGHRILTLEDEAGAVTEVVLSLNSATRERWYLERRPEMVSELEPGILYADLTKIPASGLAEAMVQFETADAIIFDVRGYPEAPPSYLAHMTDKTTSSAAMNIAIQTRPDAEFDRFKNVGWTIEPELPRYSKNIVWITDGSAASYPESILGTVKANGLGTIIGSATAGANGNVATIRLPGGYVVRWTGMQVINLDGSQHHNIGVLPDILVEPTVAGVRSGRDELLEAALAEVKRQESKD